jgi:spore coat polysaccharide biosynthesis protein SpsF
MKVVCTLACRVQSTRLYGKPLQFLNVDKKITILDYLLDHLAETSEIDEVVLAISDGVENTPFIELAEKRGLQYVIGDQKDVLGRLIAAGQKGEADIVFRVTSECPFIYMDALPNALQKHIDNQASLTVMEGLPEGAYFELINLHDLQREHDEGEDRHRSELCTLFINENPDKFKIQILDVPHPELKRPDIRITVDWPEDLIVVREVYKALKSDGEFIDIQDIIDYLDAHPELNKVNNWIDAGTGRIWK